MVSQSFVPEAIMLSFIQLLEKEKYADISVIHLCQKAAVGKASFYRYFNSKEHLLMEVIHSYTGRWLISAKSLEISTRHYNNMTKENFLTHVYSNQSFYKSLYDNKLFHFLKPSIEKIVDEQLPDPKAAPYVLAWMIGGLLSFVEEWVAQDFREDPDEIDRLLQEYLEDLEKRKLASKRRV